MYFLIEADKKDDNLIPKYEWQLELINNIKYQNQIRDKKDQIFWQLVLSPDWDKSFIPVGSVEFVHNFMEYNNIPIPPPINIPKELFRRVEIEELDPEIINTDKRISLLNSKFIKSTTKIKHPENGISLGIPIGEWQVTNIVDIDIEIRCFIFNGILMDIKPYSGKWWTTDYNSLEHYIKQCIYTYKSAPPAYTLDIGIKKYLENDDYGQSFHRDKYYILEAHNFYSCGLYGFSMPHHFPQMLSQWYYWWLRKNKIRNEN